MKQRFFFLSFICSALSACFQGSVAEQKKEPNRERFEAPMPVPPFLDIPVAQAQQMAANSNRRCMVLLIDSTMDLKTLRPLIGIRESSLSQWERDFVCVVRDVQEEDARALMKKHQIVSLPAVLKFDRKKNLEHVLYGRVWPGNELYLSKTPAEKLLEMYSAGNLDKRLLTQLHDHLTYLELPGKDLSDLRVQVNNDILNSFSQEELLTYAGYRTLVQKVDDVRLDVVDQLFTHRASFNQKFRELAREHNLKNHTDADGMLRKALRRSFERAAKFGDADLFERAQKSRVRFEDNYLDPWIAKSILYYHLNGDEESKTVQAALQYFAEDPHWSYSRQYALMELSAAKVEAFSPDAEAWKQAERWISVAISQGTATPSRYELHARLLAKLGDEQAATELRNKVSIFRKEFEQFAKLYPPAQFPIQLPKGNLSKKAYKKLTSIPRVHQKFYSYISMEGNLFKQGEKIEPIAVLTANEEEVELLSRVHLATGSLLPVTHIRSYYVASRFSVNGGHKGNRYETRKEIVSP